MPWKHDLAKLKQQLKEDPPPVPSVVPKKALPVPAGPKSMADEDALFLSAMGKARPASTTSLAVPSEPLPAPATPPTPALETDFASAMAGLGGLKRLPAALPEARPKPVEAASAQVAPTPAPAPPAPEPVPAAPEPTAETVSPGLPLRIQLAAGMALEVDGHLDLRGHSRLDAVERLRDRLEDARFMHWRSLHLTLGSDPALHEALQDLLQSGGLPHVLRFAQAPVPMGGAQAWILYLTA